jgi:two-component system, cell cycle sensor histidine kinase and response regulator CckA
MLICLFPEGEDASRTLASVLESLGFEVRVAALPTEPLIAEAELAVIQLPAQLDEAVKLLRLWRGLLPPGHPLLALGQWTGPAEIEKLLQAGASDYLTHPCETRELQTRLLVLHSATFRLNQDLLHRLADTQRVESLSALAGSLAHDFNNLLAAILGNAEVALLDPNLSDSTRYSLTQIDRASRHAAELTRQMMTFSGRPSPDFAPVQLAELVEEMTDILRASISRACQVEFRFDPELPPVLGEASQLRQVVMNLLINASEAMMPGGGVIRVIGCQSRKKGQPRVILEVRDSGTGVPVEVRHRIFDPFYSTKRPGRGLGLAAVRSIVESHGGEVSVLSHRGDGATFRLEFPGMVSAGSRRVTSISSAPATISGSVLLVEVDDSLREAASHLLARSNFQVHPAASAREAARLFHDHTCEFQAVIMDLTLGDGNAESFLRMLRTQRPGLRVVIWSGFDEIEIHNRTTGFDISAIVRKPSPVRELVSALSHVLSNPPGAVA